MSLLALANFRAALTSALTFVRYDWGSRGWTGDDAGERRPGRERAGKDAFLGGGRLEEKEGGGWIVR